MPDTTTPTVRTFVEYEHPGSFYAETGTREVTSRDPAATAAAAPADVFAFTFYDQVEATAEVGGTAVLLASRRINRSSRYLIDTELLTIADVEALPGDNKILLSNMRGNDWDPIALHRTGNFQPFDPNSEVIINTRKPVSR